MARVLIYTVAFDPPGYGESKIMAKLLVLSLLRTALEGEIVIFRNSFYPIFSVAPNGVTELQVETPSWQGPTSSENCLLESLKWRFQAAKHLDIKGFDRVVYLDADCLALRNLDHLFDSEASIIIQKERGRSISHPVFNGYLTEEELQSLQNKSGINAGTIAWKSDVFHDSTQEWQEVFNQEPLQHEKFRDQTSWNRYILDTPMRVLEFERGEIAFPLHLNPNYLDYSKSALLHFVGGMQKDKSALSFALYMQKFYHEQTGIFLNLLES